jgi:hypothetical protein
MGCVRRRWVDAVCVLLLGAGIALALWDGLAPGRALLFRDHASVFRPLFWNVQQELRAGRWPSLTRFSQAGVPAEQAFVAFSYVPPVLLLLLGDFDRLYELFVAAHFFILGVGVFVLARRLGARPEVALLSASIAALSGPVLSLENLLVTLAGLTWTPWILVGIHALLRRPGPRTAALLAFPLAFQAQAGAPSYLLLDILAAAFLLRLERPKSRRSAAIALAGSAVLALLLAAIDLGPLLEAASTSGRWRGFSAEAIGEWSLRPAQLFDLVAPAFWAPPELPFAVVRDAVGSNRAPFLTSLYLGPAVVLLVAGGFAPGAQRGLRAALLIAAVGLVLVSFGELSPLFARIPLLRSERYPIKYFVLAVSLGSALAPGSLLLPPRRLALLGLVPLGLLLMLAIALPAPEFQAFVRKGIEGAAVKAHFVGLDPASHVGLLIEAMTARVQHGLAAVGAVVALSLAASVSRPARSTFPWCLALLVLSDLASAGRFTVAGAELLREPSPLEALAAERDPGAWIYLTNGEAGPAAAARHAGKTLFDDWMLSTQKRGFTAYRRARLSPDVDRDAQMAPLALLGHRLLGEVQEGSRALELLGRLGVAWIGSSLPDDLPGVQRFAVEGESPLYALPNPKKRPPVEAFTRWERLDPAGRTPSELLLRVTDPAKEKTAFLLGEPEPGEGAPAADVVPCAEVSSATVAPRRTIAVLEVAVSGACPALLVAEELHAPGWIAEVDGRRAPLVEADFGFLAVFVPPGAHQVRFSYADRTRIWAWVSLAGLAIAVFAARSERRGSSK